uniref:AraC-like ligand-binding domain-containing protein n=1 Tax=Rhodococcus qingshengii TaxID=334542 RepID=UPI003556DC9A
MHEYGLHLRSHRPNRCRHPPDAEGGHAGHNSSQNTRTIISRTIHVLPERQATRRWSRHGKWARTSFRPSFTRRLTHTACTAGSSPPPSRSCHFSNGTTGGPKNPRHSTFPACSDQLVPLRIQSASTRIAGSIPHQSFDGVRLSRVRTGSQAVARMARIIAQEPRGEVLMSLHMAGIASVSQASRNAQLTPNGGVLYESERSYSFLLADHVDQTVISGASKDVASLRTCLRTGHVRASRRVMRTIMAMRTIASWWSGLVSWSRTQRRCLLIHAKVRSTTQTRGGREIRYCPVCV